ncbi:MAG: hypothetical protein QW445_07610 [Candidatus Bathyarchaeia archaeon]
MEMRRGASEIVGALIILGITMAMAVSYVSLSAMKVDTQMSSFADIIRARAKAQNQLLSLSYYYQDSNMKLHLFIYNAGKEDAAVSKLFVGAARYDMPQAVIFGDVVFKDVSNGQSTDPVVPARKLVEVIAPSAAAPFDVVVITAEKAYFVWRVTL